MRRRDYNEFLVFLGVRDAHHPIVVRTIGALREAKIRTGKVCCAMTPAQCTNILTDIMERVERKKRTATIALYAPLCMQEEARQLARAWRGKAQIEVTIRDYEPSNAET